MAAETIRALDTTDPLVLLPAEIVLRVLDYASPASLASLTRLTKAWNAFIDGTHQDAIYSSPSKTIQPASAKNFSFLDSSRDFSKYFKGVQSWKEICRRQTLLTKGWTRERPVTRESTIQVGNDPIWRFRPDFKRRIFLSTSQMGGMNVTDMDSGNLLWRLDANTVRPFAHLEYEDGTAVWDREGNAVEVWRADPDAAKGVFQQVAVLEHDRQTRGFQLSSNTLCVVSSEKKGYVYDLSGEPTLKREIDIEDGAVGHLDQGPGVVAYSLGNKGYHFFNKDTGESLGVLHPKDCTKTYHIIHPRSPLDSRLGVGNVGRAADAYPPQYPGKDRTTPIEIKQGRHPLRPAVTETPLSDDEWGAGMLSGKLFAGVSRGGRVFVCSDWRKALESTASFTDATCTIECDSDGSTFDLGGWLAIRNHKLMFETQDRAYIVGLNDDDTVRAHDQNPQRPSFAYATSAAAQLAVPVSFMGIYDDCVMTTFTVLRPPLTRPSHNQTRLMPATDPPLPPARRSGNRRPRAAAHAYPAHEGHPHPVVRARPREPESRRRNPGSRRARRGRARRAAGGEHDALGFDPTDCDAGGRAGAGGRCASGDGGGRRGGVGAGGVVGRGGGGWGVGG